MPPSEIQPTALSEIPPTEMPLTPPSETSPPPKIYRMRLLDFVINAETNGFLYTEQDKEEKLPAEPALELSKEDKQYRLTKKSMDPTLARLHNPPPTNYCRGRSSNQNKSRSYKSNKSSLRPPPKILYHENSRINHLYSLWAGIAFGAPDLSDYLITKSSLFQDGCIKGVGVVIPFPLNAVSWADDVADNINSSLDAFSPAALLYNIEGYIQFWAASDTILLLPYSLANS